MLQDWTQQPYQSDDLADDLYDAETPILGRAKQSELHELISGYSSNNVVMPESMLVCLWRGGHCQSTDLPTLDCR
jgi:carotenoid cleavage dioxygenase-like enzyme